ncbi:uncharacterized protein LOC112042063 [Lingula anatina]|uniref:Uncharacterized protein LOC112042063 n=1 Tax=Lingula anatina TaxID=7574 RepID=A0A2R2MND5_LINAN|nr:uncharacterized protein LOC112042063 [Lingula anatina]|eukprot:XP_023931738.1 uncharacterized protein LOC112042063 [Lingula anatina]
MSSTKENEAKAGLSTTSGKSRMLKKHTARKTMSSRCKVQSKMMVSAACKTGIVVSTDPERVRDESANKMAVVHTNSNTKTSQNEKTQSGEITAGSVMSATKRKLVCGKPLVKAESNDSFATKNIKGSVYKVKNAKVLSLKPVDKMATVKTDKNTSISCEMKGDVIPPVDKTTFVKTDTKVVCSNDDDDEKYSVSDVEGVEVIFSDVEELDNPVQITPDNIELEVFLIDNDVSNDSDALETDETSVNKTCETMFRPSMEIFCPTKNQRDGSHFENTEERPQPDLSSPSINTNSSVLSTPVLQNRASGLRPSVSDIISDIMTSLPLDKVCAIQRTPSTKRPASLSSKGQDKNEMVAQPGSDVQLGLGKDIRTAAPLDKCIVKLNKVCSDSAASPAKVKIERNKSTSVATPAKIKVSRNHCNSDALPTSTSNRVVRSHSDSAASPAARKMVKNYGDSACSPANKKVGRNRSNSSALSVNTKVGRNHSNSAASPASGKMKRNYGNSMASPASKKVGQNHSYSSASPVSEKVERNFNSASSASKEVGINLCNSTTSPASKKMDRNHNKIGTSPVIKKKDGNYNIHFDSPVNMKMNKNINNKHASPASLKLKRQHDNRLASAAKKCQASPAKSFKMIGKQKEMAVSPANKDSSRVNKKTVSSGMVAKRSNKTEVTKQARKPYENSKKTPLLVDIDAKGSEENHAITSNSGPEIIKRRHKTSAKDESINSKRRKAYSSDFEKKGPKRKLATCSDSDSTISKRKPAVSTDSSIINSECIDLMKFPENEKSEEKLTESSEDATVVTPLEEKSSSKLCLLDRSNKEPVKTPVINFTDLTSERKTESACPFENSWSDTQSKDEGEYNT